MGNQQTRESGGAVAAVGAADADAALVGSGDFSRLVGADVGREKVLAFHAATTTVAVEAGVLWVTLQR